VSAIIVPHRTLYPVKRARALYERRNRDFIFKYPARAGYRNTSSPPRGLHYGAAAGIPAFTREVFLVSNPAWVPPIGVIDFDVLLVGSGGTANWCADAGLIFLMTAAGGGGGSILVQNAVPHSDPLGYNVIVAPVAEIRLANAPFTTIAGPSQVGGEGPLIVSAAAIGGGPPNGSGGGGAFDPIAGDPTCVPGGAGAGSGNAGGNGDGLVLGPPGVTGEESAGGGGGGAATVGSGAAASAPGGAGQPGDGGNGAIPPPSTFGPWGNDIGEGGFFSGGGGGAQNTFGASPWLLGNRGVGGGAANTGGGATANPFPDQTNVSGFTGIVVVIYQTP